MFRRWQGFVLRGRVADICGSAKFRLSARPVRGFHVWFVPGIVLHGTGLATMPLRAGGAGAGSGSTGRQGDAARTSCVENKFCYTSYGFAT